MGKQIKVVIDKRDVLIDSDTPNFDELVSIVIGNKDFDFNQIVVSCQDENFDTIAFKNALVNVITSVTTNIALEKTKLDDLLKKISDLKGSATN